MTVITSLGPDWDDLEKGLLRLVCLSFRDGENTSIEGCLPAGVIENGLVEVAEVGLELSARLCVSVGFMEV